MWILIAGPYTAGGADAELRAARLDDMNAAAVEVFRRGHVPIIGVNAALPMIDVAGQDSYDEIMMPLALQLADRCDAVLRIGEPSAGADEEMQRVADRGKPVYRSIADIPDAGA